MISIFTHVMKPIRDTNSEPGLPVVGTPIQYVILGPGGCGGCLRHPLVGKCRWDPGTLFSCYHFLLVKANYLWVVESAVLEKRTTAHDGKIIFKLLKQCEKAFVNHPF